VGYGDGQTCGDPPTTKVAAIRIVLYRFTAFVGFTATFARVGYDSGGPGFGKDGGGG
jgi:hypothetical protein